MHAADAQILHDQIPAHPLIPDGPFDLIHTNQQLSALLEQLRSAGSFAYDSEFIGELSYHPRLCLIQVATAQRITLIDPVGEIDLRPFWELLCDPAVEKIVHAGEQDMEPVVRHLGKSPQNVLDTQIAAGFAAMAYPVSLSKLVLQLTGAKLGKGLTFTDWSQRPLSAVQLRYAADDVRYLPAIAEELRHRLEGCGHLAWAREESAALGDPSRFTFDPSTDYLRVRGASGLTPQGLAVLRELAAWRDSAAQKADTPPRAYLKDEILIDMSRSPVRTVAKLDRVRGLPRPIEAEHGQTLVELTARGLEAEHDSLPPRHPEPTPAQRFAADSLWGLVQMLCASQDIDSNLVTSRQELGELHRHLAEGSDPSGLRLMRGWRLEAVGRQLTDMVRQKIALTVKWDGDRLVRGPVS
jgi:ribonuclease D